MENSGIYCITNLINNKKYIGKSINIKRRFSAHKSGAKRNSKDINRHLKNAFLTDILYLSGGDTILFCKNIKQKKIDKEIFKFVKKKDKVLSGLSAGAIIMTPKLNIVKLIDKKNNEFNVSGLGLINFEVFPHYQVKQHKKIIFEELKKNTPKTEILRIIKQNDSLLINKTPQALGQYIKRQQKIKELKKVTKIEPIGELVLNKQGLYVHKNINK